MPIGSFEKRVIGQLDNSAHTWFNTLFAAGDINGDGRMDLAVCGRKGLLAWFENPGSADGEWKRHIIGEVQNIECGGSVYDLTGNGLGDLILTSDGSADELFWLENPGTESGEWKKHLIFKTGRNQFHDSLIVEGRDGEPTRLYFTNQGGGTCVYRVPVPEDPTVSPWPDIEQIGRDKALPNPHNPWNKTGMQSEEGLAVGDIDGDGEDEVVCGTHWYKKVDGQWRDHQFAHDYITTKVAIADVDGDGRNEIILAEGDACCYGKEEGAKFAWFKPAGDITALWTEHRVAEGLLDPHSLRVADIFGAGRADIFIGELGKLKKGTDDYYPRDPEVMLYENLGGGEFKKRVIDTGTGIHEAVLLDLDGDGKLDIAGRPLFSHEKWNVHVFYQK